MNYKALMFALLVSGIFLTGITTTSLSAQSRVMSAQEITAEISSLKDEVTRLESELTSLEADNKLLSSQLENTLTVTETADATSGNSALTFLNLFFVVGLGAGLFYVYRSQRSGSAPPEPLPVDAAKFEHINEKIEAIEFIVKDFAEKVNNQSTAPLADTEELESNLGIKIEKQLDQHIGKLSAEITTLKTIQKELEERISENEKRGEESGEKEKPKKKKSRKKKPKAEPAPSLFDLIDDEVQASITDSSDEPNKTEEKATEPVDAEPDVDVDVDEPTETQPEPDQSEPEPVAEEAEETPEALESTVDDSDNIADPESEPQLMLDDEATEEQTTDEQQEVTEDSSEIKTSEKSISDESVKTLAFEDEPEESTAEHSEPEVTGSDEDEQSAAETSEELETKPEEEAKPAFGLKATKKAEIDEADESNEPLEDKTTSDNKDEDGFGADFWEAVEALEEKESDNTDTIEPKEESKAPAFGLSKSKPAEEPVKDTAAADDVQEEQSAAPEKPVAQTEETAPKSSLSDALERMRKLTEKPEPAPESKNATKTEEKPDVEPAAESETTSEKPSGQTPKVAVNAAGKSKLADNFEERLNFLKQPEEYAIAARNYPEETEIKENWALSLINRGYEQNIDDDIIDAINLMEGIIQKGGKKEGLAHQIMADGLYHLGLLKGEKNFFTRANNQYKKVTEKSGYDGVSMYTNWGNSLINLYYITNKDAHLKEALDKFKVVNNIYTHAGNYNIARVFNLLGDQSVAMEWLESAFKHKIRLPELDAIKSEPALKNVIGNPHFQKLVKRYNIS